MKTKGVNDIEDVSASASLAAISPGSLATSTGAWHGSQSTVFGSVSE